MITANIFCERKQLFYCKCYLNFPPDLIQKEASTHPAGEIALWQCIFEDSLSP